MTSALEDLEKRIAARAGATAEKSYTRSLLDKGAPHCAKKMGEEAVELVIAAVSEDRARLISEAADVLYHMLVVLKARDVPFAEVEKELAQRAHQSGHEEKASRPR